MTDPMPPLDEPDTMTAVESQEIARRIDALMAQPAKGGPAITVVGDEHVFAIDPPRA